MSFGRFICAVGRQDVHAVGLWEREREVDYDVTFRLQKYMVDLRTLHRSMMQRRAIGMPESTFKDRAKKLKEA